MIVDRVAALAYGRGAVGPRLLIIVVARRWLIGRIKRLEAVISQRFIRAGIVVFTLFYFSLLWLQLALLVLPLLLRRFL